MPIDLSNAHPSDVVVPLSDMLDLLSSRLEEDELDTISEELIRRRSTQVAAGDVISAELMNQILADIGNLQTRMMVLEEGIPDVDRPQIVLVNPSNGVRIGEPLEVSGFNLAPEQLTSVRIAGRTVSVFSAASHSRLLVFEVPSILGIPEEGADVSLEISNEFGSDDISVRVERTRVTELSTAISLGYVSFPNEELEANSDYTITVRITALTSLAATYTLSVNVDNTGWSAAIADGASQIVIPQSQPTPFVTDVDVIVTTGASGTANFTMSIVAVGHPDQNGISEPPLFLSIGDVTEANTEITFQPPLIADENIDLTTGNFLLSPGRQINFGVNAILAVVGNYNISDPIITGNTGEVWAATLLSPSVAAANQVEVEEIHQNFIRLQLATAATTATPDAQLSFTISRVGSNEPPAIFSRTIEVIS